MDNIYTNFNSNKTAEKIENIFFNDNFRYSFKKEYFENTNAYYIIVAY